MTAASMVVVGCTTRPAGVGVAMGPGEIATRPGRPGLVVAAPRATSDVGTAAMATEIARLSGFGLVVAAGFHDNDGSVDAAYERRVRDVAQGRLQFYVEIHGASGGESADRIEIATVGVDAEQAPKLRTLLELVRDAHLRERAPGLRLPVRVEPADSAFAPTSGTARTVIFRLPQRALSIALPRAARQEGRELYAQILADFLREAITLPLPARR